jgi:hypothetical protein
MNSEIEKQLWEKAEKYIHYLQVVPFLKMVAVCNNLAFGKVDDRSDIDLFIIAKRGRLFIVRTFVTLILHVLGVRRHNEKIAGRFCLSFFVDEDGMNMRKIALENDIYLAFWARTMVPLIDDGVSEKFLAVNSWMNKYFEEEIVIDKKRVVKKESSMRKVFSWIFDGWIGNRIEKMLMRWQMKRAKEKMIGINLEVASLVVEEHILKFHNVDRRKEYRKKWFDKYGKGEFLDRDKLVSLNIK